METQNKTFIEEQTQIQKIRWHIESNFYPPYPEKVVDGMIDTITQYLKGKLQLNSLIRSGYSITVSDLLSDLRLGLDTLYPLLFKS